jgi:hypothetical protein
MPKPHPSHFTAKFYTKYADRLIDGTDTGFDKEMYRVTFRSLETLDEHFYDHDMFGYHWSLAKHYVSSIGRTRRRF